jgi:glycosyltransferase involved in cell wall biosynthesis
MNTMENSQSVTAVLPIITVVMPTFNSEKTVRKSLESVRAQEYPDRLVEVILADGGSTDKTINIAKEFNCKILHNERLQPECGKQIGIQNAKGKYVVFLDSDEVLQRKDSFRRKVEYLEKGSVKAKNFVTAGLLNPQEYPDINDYTNRYGDPFSAYMYGIDGGDYYSSLEKRYRIVSRDSDVLVVEFSEDDFLPIVDGGGHMFDLEFIKKHANIDDLNTIPNIFNIAVSHTRQLGVLRGDFIEHYSTVSLKKYVQKIRWRIISNLFYADKVGAGFQEKQAFQPKWFKIKKYLFIPYSISLILPVLRSLILLVSHRKPVYLLHGPLSFITGIMILYYSVLHVIGIKPQLSAYGKK